jgi:hypothetical protein
MSLRRVRAVLGIDREIIPEVSSGAKTILAGLSSKPSVYTAPTPTLQILSQQITDLDTSHELVKTVRGSAPARNAKRNILWTSLEMERMYVQSLADLLPPEQASAVITGAGMYVGIFGAHNKPIIFCKPGVSGTVHVFVNVGVLAGNSKKNKTFFWQSTADGKVFNNLPSTPEPTISVSGLAPQAMIGFRAAVKVSKMPQGDWTQVVYIAAP